MQITIIIIPDLSVPCSANLVKNVLKNAKKNKFIRLKNLYFSNISLLKIL